MSENRALRRISEPKRRNNRRMKDNEELHILYSSPDIFGRSNQGE
jgi:hypothetical protein